MASQVEGSDVTGPADAFLEWLSQSDFPYVLKIKTRLEEQGIKSVHDFKKYVENTSDFNNLISKLNINFVEERLLEKSWKSIHINVSDKLQIQETSQNMPSDNNKYNDISADIAAVQTSINDVNKTAIQCKKSLNSELDEMIKIIERSRIKLNNDIDQRRIKKENKMNQILNQLKNIQTIYFQNDNDLDEKQKDIVSHLNYTTIPFIDTIYHKKLNKDNFTKDICYCLEVQQNTKLYTMKYQNITKVSNKMIGFSYIHGTMNNFELTQNNKNVTIINSGNCTVFCNNGWNAGVHAFSIKCEYSENSDAHCIGVVTSLSAEFRGNGCDIKDKGISYMLRCGCGTAELKGSKKDETIIQLKLSNMIWHSGETVKVVLDCDNWTVEFVHYISNCMQIGY